MSLQDKVVVIMGASSGIGAATAKLLASKGAKVTIAARRMNRLEEIKQANPDSDILAVEADVTKAKEVQNVVDQTVAKFGRVDALYNNAGIMPVNNLDQIAQDEWQNMLDINVKGVLNGIAAALPVMKKQKSGHIITTSSVLGYEVLPGYAAYSGTKYAVRAIMEGLRQEQHNNNIRTTIVSPGSVATELYKSIGNADNQKAEIEVEKQIGLSAENIAKSVVFAINAPENMDLNEMIIRPIKQDI